MTSETSSNPKQPLLLEDIIQMAKRITLRDGYHTLTLIADGSDQTMVTQLEKIAATHEGRAQQFFMLGMVLAERKELGVLQQVFLITEAWMSVATPDNAPHDPPSRDPQRKEILSIARLVLLPRRIEMVVLEMKRNLAGTLIALEAFERQSGSQDEHQVESPLLEAFVIGFLGDASRSED